MVQQVLKSTFCSIRLFWQPFYPHNGFCDPYLEQNAASETEFSPLSNSDTNFNKKQFYFYSNLALCYDFPQYLLLVSEKRTLMDVL